MAVIHIYQCEIIAERTPQLKLTHSTLMLTVKSRPQQSPTVLHSTSHPTVTGSDVVDSSQL